MTTEGLMLDEESLRRPDFLPGIPVRMADGQLWSLPEAPDRYPRMAYGGAPRREYAATVAAVLDAEDEAERRRAELALTIALLARNYDLGPAEYQELLGGESGGPATATLQRAFHNVALEHMDSSRPRAVAGPVRRPRGCILSRLGHFWAWAHRSTDPASGLPEVSGVR
jgi:hypothetical protein